MVKKPRAANYDILLRAMRDQLPISAVYGGHYREMSPHVLGHKRDRLHCLFYQFGGESSSGPVRDESPDNWRCIPVAELTALRIHDGPWHWGAAGARKNADLRRRGGSGGGQEHIRGRNRP